MNRETEFTKFDSNVRTLLSVSRDEIKRREEEWKNQNGPRKAGRKATKKRSVSSRVVSEKD
jgi:hypothetical protein